MINLDVENLKKIIIDLNFQWEPDQNKFLEFSKKNPQHLLGYVPGPGEKSLLEREKIAKDNFLKLRTRTSVFSLPTSFDLRNVDGKNYMTPIKDQSGCGSCVAFGCVAAVEGTFKRQQGNPDLNVDYSEAHLFYCFARNDGRNCQSGWTTNRALNSFQNVAVANESCFPYTAMDQECNLCVSSDMDLNKITNWNIIRSADQMKQWLVERGPLVTCFTLYTDFFAYGSGIYRTTFGSDPSVKPEGGHCVCCVGYNDIENYWICKNSWGPDWGENGYFKIGYGDSGIDYEMLSIEGVYNVTSLVQLLKAKRFTFPTTIRNIANELNMEQPISTRQLMEKLKT